MIWNIINTVLSVAASIAVSWWFFRKSSQDLNNAAERLERANEKANTNILRLAHGLDQAGIAKIREAKPGVLGITLYGKSGMWVSSGDMTAEELEDVLAYEEWEQRQRDAGEEVEE